jgi:hypothetical protein
MRISLGLCLIMFGAGCAHSPEKTSEASTAAQAQALSAKAAKSRDALDFPACAEQFRQAAEASKDADSQSDSFYNAARCAALAGTQPQAIELLKRAVQSGYYDPDTLQYDMELTSLHSVAGWQEVLSAESLTAPLASTTPIWRPTSPPSWRRCPKRRTRW